MDDPDAEAIRMLVGFGGYEASVGFWKGKPIMERLTNFQADLSFRTHLDAIRERANERDQRQGDRAGGSGSRLASNERSRGIPTQSFVDTARWWSLPSGRLNLTLRSEPLMPNGLLPWPTVQEHLDACLDWMLDRSL